MNVDWCFTNKDCEKCCHSEKRAIGCDCETHMWVCHKNSSYEIDGALDPNNKPCGLSAGEYYEAKTTYKIHEQQTGIL